MTQSSSVTAADMSERRARRATRAWKIAPNETGRTGFAVTPTFRTSLLPSSQPARNSHLQQVRLARPLASLPSSFTTTSFSSEHPSNGIMASVRILGLKKPRQLPLSRCLLFILITPPPSANDFLPFACIY